MSHLAGIVVVVVGGARILCRHVVLSRSCILGKSFERIEIVKVRQFPLSDFCFVSQATSDCSKRMISAAGTRCRCPMWTDLNSPRAARFATVCRLTRHLAAVSASVKNRRSVIVSSLGDLVITSPQNFLAPVGYLCLCIHNSPIWNRRQWLSLRNIPSDQGS